MKYKLSASNIVAEINRLPKDRFYDYPNSRTKTKLAIIRVDSSEGPIVIKRWGTQKSPTLASAKFETISAEMIWRIANAFTPGVPINFDRVLGASYNTRSAFEALLLHTPQFYNCKPGRIEILNTTTRIKKGHKHVLWLPESPHELGLIETYKTDMVVSEAALTDTAQEAVELPISVAAKKATPQEIETQRIHAQMQVAIIEIGKALGFRTWVAKNDHAIIYKNKKLIEMEDVVKSLADEQLLMSYSSAAKAAELIDCIWFKNGKLMPAVIEIEQSTGVTSGLARMKKFKDEMPPFPVRWVIAAPNGDRDKVIKKSRIPQFKDLDIKYMSYSAIQELYSLVCQQGKNKGITDEFIDNYMEAVWESEIV